jgi:hypothetical protein
MYYLRSPKTLRKNLRTNIKKTNIKKLKISKVELREYEKECRYHVA